jgi:hypothetical protein
MRPNPDQGSRVTFNARLPALTVDAKNDRLVDWYRDVGFSGPLLDAPRTLFCTNADMCAYLVAIESPIAEPRGG